MSDYVYMKITRDKFELPVAVAETEKELAIICGVRTGTIKRIIHKSKMRGHKCSYIKVIVEEDDYDD